MVLFVLVFFSLYGGMHLYALWRTKSALQLSPLLTATMGAFMVLMTLAPLLIRLSEKKGLDTVAISLAWVGYTWMAVLFVFVFFCLSGDVLRVLIFLFTKEMVPLRYIFFISLGISLALNAYGLFEAVNIKTERITISSPGLKKPVKIVQISDLHIGLIVRTSRLQRVAELIKKEASDILVSTGDLVDGQADRVNGLSEILKDIPTVYGKFAVTGNHEFYAGLEEALEFTRKAGFQVLRNRFLYIKDLNLTIAGVDDPTALGYGLKTEVSEADLLRSVPQGSFVLLLKHRPLVDRASVGLFDLQLSGHTHKGQIFPFSIFTALFYGQDSGMK
ncbi:MAG: metallophosphoesterase, partial [Nitrospirae bacterium]